MPGKLIAVRKIARQKPPRQCVPRQQYRRLVLRQAPNELGGLPTFASMISLISLGPTPCVAKKPERSTGQAGGIQKYRRLVLLDCSASRLNKSNGPTLFFKLSKVGKPPSPLGRSKAVPPSHGGKLDAVSDASSVSHESVSQEEN